ncbi:MAG: hypothetical protein LLF76_10860 [Planctomycetaceae bacterium]|nr:hypothetical protein [Planctomycetaceae bacterium]
MQIPGGNNAVSKVIMEGPCIRQACKHPARPDNNVGASLESGFEAIVNKALTPAQDQELIEKTRMELNEGRLESDLAFEQAADNLFRYGL